MGDVVITQQKNLHRVTRIILGWSRIAVYLGINEYKSGDTGGAGSGYQVCNKFNLREICILIISPRWRNYRRSVILLSP